MSKTTRNLLLEWLAALLVMLGVLLMIHGQHDTAVLIVGIVLLTVGVRLAIDCGKRG